MEQDLNTEGRIVEIPASDEPVPTPKPRAVKPKATTKGAAKGTATKVAAKAKVKGYPMTPKQLAAELNVDPKKLRRHLREDYGTHHKAWELDKAQCDAMRKKLGKKAK